jgi:imidazolonepropionase-like amidohydrolase
MRHLPVTILLSVLAAASASAQTTAIVGATVHTMGPSGTLNDATVIMIDGSITAIGRGLAVPAGANRVDGSGKILTPGLISAVGQLGLVEVGAVSETVDSIQRGKQFSAGFDIADAYNPRSTLVAINRIEGITNAVIVPQSGRADANGNESHVLSGLGALVNLGAADNALDRRAAVMVANLGETGSAVAGGSRAAALMVLRAALDDAINYQQNKAAYDRGDWREYSVSSADLVALQRVLDRNIPLLVNANRASDLSAVAKLVADYGIRAIVLGGAEAWMVADELAAAGIAVILDGPDNLPGNFDHINARLESAALLNSAGVAVTFGAGFAQTHNARNLTQSAGIAAANGLPRDAALASITIVPARMYGVQDTLGSIEAGKRANLVLWPGDPLELTNYPEQVWIDGEAVTMQSRQTLLRDRYLDPASDTPPAYRR